MPLNNEVFKGTVGRIICPVKDNGYTVFELKTGEDTIKVAGQLGAVHEGEDVEITGSWDLENHFGKQVRAENCVRVMPSSNANIKKFLTGCKVRGLTKAMVGRIVDEFGEFTFDVLMHSPEKLNAVEGISEKDFEEISAAVSEIFALRELTEKFRQYEIPPRYAQKAYAQWKTAAWENIAQDPFILCEKKIGMNFRLADHLAQQLGLPGSFPHRLVEGMRNLLNNAAADGSTCMESAALLNAVSEQLGAPYFEVRKAYEQAVSDQELFTYDASDFLTYVYLPEFYRAEDYIASRIAAKLRFSPAEDFNCDAAISQDEEENGIEYEALQRQAITTAFSRGIMIMTGGPGTGKTTTIKGVIHLCERAKSKILLAAPTGRAAKRMTELTGYPASTIHRLLGAVPEDDEQFTFQHDELDPLKADVLIIDEFSMVDTALFESLLRGISLTCRLILVGDEDQLPSVGAGRLLHALIESGTIPVVRLNKI
ncbi:MAG: AAA family ATPase, partial [Oscillospiraceae bacterium]|nr:AAA family ATPase [Oscillospiraceae bacterium]